MNLNHVSPKTSPVSSEKNAIHNHCHESSLTETEKWAEKCRHCSGYEEKIEPCVNEHIWRELAESQKHEIICHISQILGDEPCKLAEAEEIFNQIKYSIAEYVLKYEYNRHQKLSVEITLWLEEKKNPQCSQSLNYIIDTYLKSV